jgi:2-oxoglutarate ferredoxin oxidoreductase subunit alpha
MFGRNGESPVPIVCARTPADAFEAAYEAVRIAIKYMVPVVLLSDGYVANGAEPWRIPDADALPEIDVEFAKGAPDGERFEAYARNPETLARPWAIPGTAGAVHRIGGLEKSEPYGDISYDSDNHQHMTNQRAEKVARIARDIPPLEPFGGPEGDVLVLGWGGTAGAITAAVTRLRQDGVAASCVCLRHLNPFPSDLGDVMKRFRRVVIPELNSGQLALLVRAKYLVDAVSYTKVEGLPFTSTEIIAKAVQVLEESKS